MRKPATSAAGGGTAGGRRKLRAQWSEIPLERKLAIFIPVLLALMTGVAVPVVLRILDRGDEVEAGVLSVAGIELQDSHKEASVTLTLGNQTDRVAVIGRTDFRVLTSVALERCQGVFQDPVQSEVTGRYLLELPPETGDTVRVATRQKIPPNEADSFIFDVSAWNGRPTLYQLGISVYHDGRTEPLAAGTVLMILPWPNRTFLPPPGRPVAEQQCAARNRSAIERFLQLEGERSAQLARLSL